MIVILTILSLAIIGFGIAIWIIKRPMYCCLTFDDGLKVHSTIAAPLLEKLGWKGSFNIPTSFMNDLSVPRLTAEQADDCFLVGHENNLMNWNDVNGLIAAGHEVYPHTLDHSGLLRLQRAGAIEEMLRQIRDSKAEFISRTGIIPKFFCTPHNSTSALIEKMIHDNGMELLGPGRANYGTVVPDEDPLPIKEHLQLLYRQGSFTADIAIHGIDKSKGGWSPFDTAQDFADFLEKIKEVENEGLIRVTPYSQSHRHHSLLAPLQRIWDCLCLKFRRIVFTRLLFPR